MRDESDNPTTQMSGQDDTFHQLHGRSADNALKISYARNAHGLFLAILKNQHALGPTVVARFSYLFTSAEFRFATAFSLNRER